MLQFIRDRAQGWLAYVVVGLIIIPFALWGISSYFEGGGQANVATVNGTDISLRKYQQIYQMQRNRVRSMLGDRANADFIDSLVKPQDVIDGLVEDELLVQKAHEDGYRVADQQLAAQIQSIEAFQQDGEFSNTLYAQILSAQGETLTGFEARMQRSLLINQMNAGLKKSAFVTKNDVDSYIRADKQQREIGHMILPVANFKQDVSVSEEQVAQYYQTHRYRFVNPERVSIEYVELRVTGLEEELEPGEEELRALYEEEKGGYGVPEERRVRHILIEVQEGQEGTGEDALLTARTKIEELAKRIEGGESFEQLAKEYSDDPGSAKEGGDLGFFGRGVMKPQFEEAAFSLKAGEVSSVVKTSFGFHIIKLDEIRPTTQKTFVEVRTELMTLYRQRKAEARFFDQAEILANLVYEQPDNLLAVADALDLKIKTSGKFSSVGGKGITGNPTVVAAAFSEEALKQGFNSEPIELGVNHLVVVRVKEHEPETQRDIKEVSGGIKSLLITEAARERCEATGRELLERIRNGGVVVEIAQEQKVTWEQPRLVGRNERKIDRQIVEHVFKMSRLVGDEGVTSGLTLGNGNFAIVQLIAVKDGDVAATGESERRTITKKLEDASFRSEYGSVISRFKDQASIKLYDGAL